MDFKIDWNELWKEKMELKRKTQMNTDYTNMWKSKENATRFWNMSRKNKVRIEKTLAGMAFTPESRVLDIGAGPGSLAIPLAGGCACDSSRACGRDNGSSQTKH